jgi:hypothetical protein
MVTLDARTVGVGIPVDVGDVAGRDGEDAVVRSDAASESYTVVAAL